METHVEKLDTLDGDVSNIKNRLTGLETRQEAQGLVQQQILTKIDGLTDAVSSISSQKGMVSTGFIVSVVAVLISAVTVILGGGAFFHNALQREIKENETDVRRLEAQEHGLATNLAVQEQRINALRDDVDEIDEHGSRKWVRGNQQDPASKIREH